MGINSFSAVEEVDQSYFKLTEDLSLSESFSSIKKLPQGSTLDGDGYKITGLTEPLFYTLEEECEIKNLTVGDSHITSNENKVGVLAGESLGCTFESITITNCSVNSVDSVSVGFLCGFCTGSNLRDVIVQDSKIESKCTAGGLIGWITGESNIANCVIDDCQITGVENVGGLVGFSDITSQVTDICVINSEIDGVQKVGGLVGEGTIQLQKCISENCTVNGVRDIGGLVGILNRNSDETVILDKCYSDNTVKGGSTNVAGFIGSIYSATVKNCFATGLVRSPSPCGFAEKVSKSSIQSSYCDNSLVSSLERECITFINMIRSSQIKDCFTVTTTNITNGNVISEVNSTEVINFYFNTDINTDTEIGTNTTLDSIKELKALAIC